MGSSCSSKKGHKDKDSVSTKSEESTAYQANVKKHPDADPKVSEDQKNHSEVDLKHEDPKATAKPGRIPTSSVSDTMSLPSPPTQSPRELPEPSLPKEILELPESNQNLITGRGLTTTTNFKARKIILYVCAADSEEFSVEKAVFHDVIVPELRNYCREKGYELHVTDLHWKNDLEKLSSHEFSDLCLSELNRQKELGHLIPVLFLSNTIGTILLPKSIETQDFKATLKKTNEKETLKKWYQVDSDAQPSCFRFSLVGPHTSGTKETAEEKEKASEEWNSEIDTLLNTLITNFPDEMKNNYLTTVVEQEVQNAISTSIDTGRRCLWLYRFFTQRPEPVKSENLIEGEQKRRLEALLNNLRGQLTEKHIIRMNVKWNQDGVIDKDIPEHAQYINTFTSYFIKYLKAVIFNIIEEDQSKVIVRSIFGIDAQLLKELKWQALYFDKVSQVTVNRDKIFQELEGYITGDAQHPLLIHGVQGSGKSAVLYKIIKNIQTWLPDSYLVFRFTKISDLSHNLIDILKTICDQLSVINSGHLTICNYTIRNFGKLLMKLISSVALQKPVIIIIDGLDHINITEMDWMPWKLPSKAKIIVSARTDSFVFHQFKSNIENNKFLINIPEFGKAEATGLLLSSVVQYSLCRHSVSLKVSNNVVSALKSCLLPLYLNVLAWRISWFGEITNEFKPMNSVNEEINFFLDLVDAKLGKDRVKMALSLISASKYGLTDSELCEILSREPIFHSDQFSLKWAPTLVFLGNFLKYLNPFLHWVSDGDNLTLKIKDTTFDEIIKQRYVQQNNLYNNLIQSYFKGFGLNEKYKNPAEKCSNQSKKNVKYYNKRKFIELPYQSILLNNNPTNEYLLNSSWLFEKICGCGVFQVIDDIVQFSSKSSLSKDLEILKSILENTHYALNYDGRQMYTQFREELKQMKLENGFWKSFFEETEIPPSKSLVPVTKIMPRAGDFEESASENLDQIDSINLIVRLIDNPNFVVSVSTEKEEIAVWNLCSGEKVRCIKGVTHPISLQLIDDVRAVVLCRRELRIYNLDEGVLVTKLKGVMNQKMAYFGLHDKNHVVTLSRNRMYVNLMHLKTGDCITTFKAGEDRFLNSLLVSGDGRILVCGDETQKPFPLLVWNLSSRKLLYDLRIPHHDFITSLSAITHEGHYVCCVAKEVVEPGPNFIVVYDLQNGTLFKKWKPGVDTTSLDISSKDSCVISGLADARILVWDLVTGNCRWSLRGHSAPVTLVRRDPCGGTFLSADVLNRDRSLRLWDLNKGELLAVYTPPKPFSACELGIGGKIIALSLQGEEEVKSLILKGPGIDPVENNAQYGETGNHGKTFILSENQGAR